jgi:MOSC N-terminal beta barrel domain
MILNDNASRTVVSAVTAVAASILLTTQYKPIARSLQVLWSRCSIQCLMLLNRSANGQDGNADNNTIVTSLYKYPVKSLRTIPCDEVVLDSKGFVGDRRFMLVTPAPVPLWGSFGPGDATHRFLTQRQCPSLARVVVQVIEGGNELLFSTELLPNQTCSISLAPDDHAPVYRSTLWGDIVAVQDMGDAVATYLQKIVSQDENVPEEWKSDGGGVRLVVQYKTDDRTANDEFVPPGARSLLGKNPSVHLGDGFPMYVCCFACFYALWICRTHLVAF